MKKQTLLLVSAVAVSLLAGCATQNVNRPAPGSKPTQEPGQVNPPDTSSTPEHKPQSGENNSQSGGASDTASSTTPVKVPPKTASEISSPAVMSLLGSADTLAKAGHMDAAASTLERALDIESRNPFVYQRLAAVRLAQSQAGQAEQMAMKSNSLAGDNPFVKASNWRLIAAARRADGDSGGASQAGQKAVGFKKATSQYHQ